MQGEAVSQNDIQDILNSFWTTEGYSNKQHAQAAYTGALDMLTKYIRKNFTPKNLPIALEHPFQFHLGNIKVGGRMDRIDRLPDGSIEIIDYKTGRNSIEEKQIKNNLQLALYTLAAKNIPEISQQNNIASIKVSLHYIETGKIVSGILTKEDLENASKKVLAKVEEIETSNFACSKSIFCQNCEYKMLCQAQI
jgi:DNA helicase-2/ATP-dependent DNA helicase PcrA